MAAEPSVRLRVLAYLDALGGLSQVEEVHQSPVAIAEAELDGLSGGTDAIRGPPDALRVARSHDAHVAWLRGTSRLLSVSNSAIVGQLGEATYSARAISDWRAPWPWHSTRI